MLKFDKLKVVTSLQNIQIKDESKFKKILRSDSVSQLIFSVNTPYSLNIKIDYDRNEAVIEFTGKILGKHYPQLISRETINECFNNINRLGICEIDNAAMMSAKVVKCDVTNDIQYNDIPQLSSYIRNNIVNHQKYICRLPKNGNLIIEKNVMTRQYRKRLTIYDKQKEMSKADNMEYMKLYDIDRLCFEGVCRFELNLNSQTQIENSLNIARTTLQEVLSSESSPIQSFVDEILADSDARPYADKKSYVSYLILKDCEYDIEKVEARMRGFHPSRGVNIGKVMQPYRDMLIHMKNFSDRNMKQELLERLS